ncbi:hypothetical protein EGN73_07970 [Arthrospiribacter ruber]|uniref:AtpZ/AtpI family protein n=2 Tax=Arthrospiribacter ruber TaxID=2487934 RepID=A0A951IYB7_9BACT|nr:hypothetical protein [Arthrospiribacter ruber]
MCAVIGLGTYLGWYVQQQSQMKFPLWLLLFSFLSVLASFYHLYSMMKKDEKNEEPKKK